MCFMEIVNMFPHPLDVNRTAPAQHIQPNLHCMRIYAKELRIGYDSQRKGCLTSGRL